MILPVFAELRYLLFLLCWIENKDKFLYWNHPTLFRSWRGPKMHFTATKMIWYSTPISTCEGLSKWRDPRINNCNITNYFLKSMYILITKLPVFTLLHTFCIIISIDSQRFFWCTVHNQISSLPNFCYAI